MRREYRIQPAGIRQPAGATLAIYDGLVQREGRYQGRCSKNEPGIANNGSHCISEGKTRLPLEGGQNRNSRFRQGRSQADDCRTDQNFGYSPMGGDDYRLIDEYICSLREGVDRYGDDREEQG